MTKAELRKKYTDVRARFEDGELFTNEYALNLDEMLTDYFGMRPTELSELAELAD